MDTTKALAAIGRTWDESIVPQLMDYVRIPNKSPTFDPDWEAHGHMEAAVQLMRRWAEAHALPGTRIEVLRLPGRTPLLMLDVPGSACASAHRRISCTAASMWPCASHSGSNVGDLFGIRT